MYEITIKGNTPAELFANLAKAAAAAPAAPATVSQIPAPPAPAVVNPTAIQSPNANPVPVVPVAAPVPVAPATVPTAAPVPVAPAPVPAAPPAPAAIPTAAPTYTLDALARAGAALAQSGKMQEALALLAKYGVQTVNQLKPEQYGAFATELRALGAQI